MCGIAGVVALKAWRDTELASLVGGMVSRLSNRGPDSNGTWVEGPLALGHARLAIQDLSESGHQPMVSRCGRYVLAFNGEIYNHLVIRVKLERSLGGYSWNSSSDTETLLVALAVWGVDQCLSELSGMFAFCLWDRSEKVLTLARDRMGEKPLYYGWVGGDFLFGSELKALRAHPHFSNEISGSALSQYLRFTYVPAPYSIWSNIYKLEPGCILEIKGKPPGEGPEFPIRPDGKLETVSIRRFWSFAKVVVEAGLNPIESEGAAKDMLKNALDSSIKEQMISDVPVGAFLSGGVDSSLVVSRMQGLSNAPIKTFTIGFEDHRFDESPHARAVARHLGTMHTEVKVTERDALDVIPVLPDLYDEPFADSSQIPTHLVSKIAKENVTVALSGDGGDELFGGYNRYYWRDRIWKYVSPVPFPLRKVAGKAIKTVDPEILNNLFRRFGGSQVGHNLHKMADRLVNVKNDDQLYLSLVSEWNNPELVMRESIGEEKSLAAFLLDGVPDVAAQNLALKMMYWDTGTYLSDDILCKVDRAAMGVSLETRVPLLHPEIVSLAWRMPLHFKKRASGGKWILRELLYESVPRELIERPKAGFGIPVGSWLRTELRDWAEDLLDEKRLEEEGFFKPAIVRTMWIEHLSGSREWTPRLWTILMFQEWWAAQKKGV
ncbi:asparagine synthase (glutamine-hydrolyzing) [Marinobacter shengliensis]|uniref:asparagine synthase (glutamine-hydrolyzing) n=1 Tax=Marinobacter shengliensis TaxID=1389223 RepID=UPI0035B89290